MDNHSITNHKHSTRTILWKLLWLLKIFYPKAGLAWVSGVKRQVSGLGEPNYLLYFSTKSLVKLSALTMPVPAFLHRGRACDLLEIVGIGVAADRDRILLDPLRRGVCFIGPFPLQGFTGFFLLRLFHFADLPL